MASAVKMRTDYSAVARRRLAKAAKDVNQSRRLLSLARIMDGMSREDAARIGSMDRQTLRDWVHCFNEDGPDGPKDAWYGGPTPRLSPEQKAELAQIVKTGPDLVRTWRLTAWCAGGASICSASSRIVSASLITSATGQAAQGTRLLAHERATAPSGAGCLDRGRV
ncbi:MAG: helix-turn-helix domain-containing protein [Mesorhizobium sp.]|nr:MAG: helix-turn-helix domain-containing protein [Mesorhizobium sp.]TJU72352.1 MAG: helix-turn-helix domain-containing protein [Mesorhizobium sp.]